MTIFTDELSLQLRSEAEQVLSQEPELSSLLHNTVLADGVESFEDAVAQTVCYRLLLQPCNKNTLQGSIYCPSSLKNIIRSAMDSEILENGHSMSHAIRQDAEAVCRRDPAMDTVLEVVLFSKGYSALVCHRAAYRIWAKRKFTALFLQSQCSAVFGLDLHPRAQIGCEIMLDHGTGIVVGETATIGDGCTMLHGVTLGGTGKDHGDRHPKVGANVLIGAGASLLGNIQIGNGAKIGAGSVVLRPIPPHATAVGAPAKIIGRSKEPSPGSDMDELLDNVSLLHKSTSTATVSTVPESTESSVSGNSDSETVGSVCPWRSYAIMAKAAPPSTVTLCTLAKMLSPLGCKTCTIGACLFAIDTRNVGYVHRDVFEKHGVDAIVEYTNLDRETAEHAVSLYCKQGKFPEPTISVLAMESDDYLKHA